MAPRYATLYGPGGQRKVVLVGSSDARRLQSQGWGLTAGSFRKPVSKGNPVPVDPLAAERDSLTGLVNASLPKPATDEELSSRFSALFDPTFQQNERDITSELDLRSSRFNEDASVAAARRDAQRRRAEMMTREAQAAGGASGQLANEQLGETLRPFNEASQDAATQSQRFVYDSAEERRKRILANQQARSGARANYLANPSLRYEFSF